MEPCEHARQYLCDLHVRMAPFAVNAGIEQPSAVDTSLFRIGPMVTGAPSPPSGASRKLLPRSVTMAMAARPMDAVGIGGAEGSTANSRKLLGPLPLSKEALATHHTTLARAILASWALERAK